MRVDAVRFAVGVLVSIGLSTGALAQARGTPMTGADIRAAFTDTVLLVDTPLGAKLPVAYGSDGTLAGHSKELAFALGSTTDRGKWWIMGYKLCHKWTVWFEKKTQCMSLSRKDQRLWWRRSDGETGTATLAAPAAQVADAAGTQSTTGSVAPRAAASPPAAVQAAERKQPIVAVKPASALNGPKPADRTAPRAATRTPTASPGGASAMPRYRVVDVAANDVLNVRAEPSSEADIVGVLPPTAGDISMSGVCVAEWCRVRTRAMSGWVNTRYLAGM